MSVQVSQDGTKLTLTIEHGLIGTEGKGLVLTFECGRDIYAAALLASVRDHLERRIQDIRKAEYEAGWKDARGRHPNGKRREKRTWFFTDLRPGTGR